MNEPAGSNLISKRPRIVRWVLILVYGVGSPIFAAVEFMTGNISQRFDYSPEFIFLVSAVQFLCALLLLTPASALVSTGVLTIFSLGAVYSHLKIGSPLTALPALILTAIQVWYGIRAFRRIQ